MYFIMILIRGQILIYFCDVLSIASWRVHFLSKGSDDNLIQQNNNIVYFGCVFHRDLVRIHYLITVAITKKMKKKK